MNDDLRELIARHLRGELEDAEKKRLASMLDRDPAARRALVEEAEWDTALAALMRSGTASAQAVAGVTAAAGVPAGASRKMLVAAALVIVALIAAVFVQSRGETRAVVRVTGLSGAHLWIGDGGRVVRGLELGRTLPGGTVEGLGPDSWIELEFNDGSTVTVLGNSMLTYSDLDRKELHLKGGKLTCDVRPQPPGQPMVVYTRAAVVEVLGTRFEVEASLAATIVEVSRGVVRLKRLSDGIAVDVPASHRAIADADRDVAAVALPDSVHGWRSRLDLGPEGTYGKWSPAAAGGPARLRAVPYTTRHGMTIYTVAFGVSRGDRPPVTLSPAARLRVRGRLASAHEMYFGVTVRRSSGEFAGNFQTTRPASEFRSGGEFDITVALHEFRLDPSLRGMKDELPKVPFGLVVESVWCHTLGEQAGLELTGVELVSGGAPGPVGGGASR